MNLRGIVSLSGKPGLFKAIGQNRSGFVLESLDEAKTKVITNANSKLATLDDITVFGLEDDITLRSILEKMKSEAASTAVPDSKSDGNILRKYFNSIAPDHDPERVYASDIKKIVSWYHILSALPLWNEEAPAEEAEDSVEE
jgi:Domain of unknown function (DUF5606)